MSERRESTEEPSLAKRQKKRETNISDDCGGEHHDLLLNRIDKEDGLLTAFVSWCVEFSPGFTISKKVYMGIKGAAANYGMRALEDIEAGEEIFRIPLQRTLSWENLLIADRLRPEVEKMAVANRWTPTILAIMLEDALMHSRWSEYLRLFLRTNELSIPLLWDEETLSQLQGLNITERVKKDRAQIAADFKNWIFPVLLREQNLTESAFDVLLKEAYRVAAFVMSYSFTRPPSDDHEEPSGNQENLDEDDSEVDEEATSVGNALMEVPLMIPVADFLNASVHKNNAKLHWNDNDEKFLTMISTKPITAGEEIFNTYGEISSEEMLYLYGYAEEGPANPHEEVFIPSEYLKDVILDLIREGQLPIDGVHVDQRWECLVKRKVVGSDLPIVLGMEGFLTDDDLHIVLQVLSMTEEQFDAYNQHEEPVENDLMEEGVYSLEKLGTLPTAVKQILKQLVKRKLADFPQSQQDYENAANRTRDSLRSDIGEDMSRRGINVELARRPFYLAYVRMRQTQLLSEYIAKLA